MRGKHGAAAAVRHEVQSATEQIETYKRAVMRLTQERNEAREGLAAEKTRNQQAERKLAAERDHGVSPRVEALNALLTKARQERDDLRRDAEKQQGKSDASYGWILRHVQKEHGLSKLEAFELLTLIVGGEDLPHAGMKGLTITEGAVTSKRIKSDGISAVQAARGMRSPSWAEVWRLAHEG